MSESEPQVPLTVQEAVAELMELARQYAHCYFNVGMGSVTHEPLSAFEDRLRAALLDHLAVRPQEQEAKDAARLDWLLSNGDCHVSAYRWQPTLGIQATRYNVYRNGLSLGFGDSPRAAIDAAIAAQSAQGKTA